MAARRTLIGAGLTAVGLGGALAARQAVIGRRSHAADTGDDAAAAAGGERLPPGVREREVATTDGARLRVLDAGSGPAVLLVHGITLSADIWHRQLGALPAAGIRAVAVDLRGHGGSVAGSGGLRFGRLADDIGVVIDALDLLDVTLVGHSMGGMVALQFLGRRRASAEARAAVGRVGALGLVATSARPAEGRGVPGALALVGVLRPAIAAASRLSALLPGPSLPDTVIGDALARLTFGRFADERSVSLTRRVTARVPARVSVELLAQVLSFDMAAVLPGIAVPTTVIVGRDDLMTPLDHASALADAIPGAKLEVLDGCGHMVMLEAPDELDAAIVELVGRVVGGGPGPAASGGRRR